MTVQLPPHVRDAFQVDDKTAEQLSAEWDYGLRVGNTVFSQALNPETAAWSSKLRENLQPQGVRVVRPIRATDGRFVVAGWRASVFAAGTVAQRIDETVVAALRLGDVLVDATVPDFPPTIFSQADSLAWAGSDDRLGHLLRPIHQNNQVVHADMLATTLFSGLQPPVVTDLAPVVRPHSYAAALVVIDGLLLNAVDDGIVARFSHLPDFDQLLLRAFLYRRTIQELESTTEKNIYSNLNRVEEFLVGHVSGTL